MPYRPPAHILQVLQQLDYEDPLGLDDERYVETQEARGSQQTFSRLARKFGWDATTGAFFAPDKKHALVFGHVGSGKTTELRRYMERFDQSKRFYVVEVDVLLKLDRNNLQYTEVLMAMAESLLERLHGDGHDVGQAALKPLHDWFTTVVTSRSQGNEFSAEVKTMAQASGGIPGLIKLLASFTAAFKHNSSTKDEWRREIRNRFTALVTAFNGLIREAEAKLKTIGRAERVLFLVDGTDKMRGEDTQRFFVLDAEQLLAIQALAIYTTPLHLKYDGSLAGKLDDSIVLPMLKLEDKLGVRWEPGWTALRKMLLLRADRSLFEDGARGDAQIARLVEACGGHPRELLRLLKLACELAGERFTDDDVTSAIEHLASEYRRFLQPEDYPLLAAIDKNPAHLGNDERAQNLLLRLALLEYNDGGWRRSHPVVRLLDGYQAATVEPPAPQTL